ncbi:hypothetical protein ACTJKO_14425 [Curtobacterium sp. 22159]|uniref:hypothetical protein n=1 Tax=Curtobacterium sp. 22159 TaxID=3453882 RepID=UPI003F8533B2
MKRGQVVWGWTTSALGAVIVLLMAGQLVEENTWSGRQVNTVGSYSSLPLYLGAVVGLVLIAGGITAAVTTSHRRRQNGDSSVRPLR